MSKLIFIVLLFAALPSAASTSDDQLRLVSGKIYFSNNAPDDVHTYPIELFTANEKQRVAATTPDAKHHQFSFKDLAPAQYVLKVSWPDHCTLRR
jgi:hypothetical protein